MLSLLYLQHNSGASALSGFWICNCNFLLAKRPFFSLLVFSLGLKFILFTSLEGLGLEFPQFLRVQLIIWTSFFNKSSLNCLSVHLTFRRLSIHRPESCWSHPLRQTEHASSKPIIALIGSYSTHPNTSIFLFSLSPFFSVSHPLLVQ